MEDKKIDTYTIKPITKFNKSKIITTVPGSKSITNRALLLAAMQAGRCRLEGVLFSDDSRVFLKCLIDLGFDVKIDEEKKEVVIVGQGGKIPNKKAKIYVGSAGTAARFITALLGMSCGEYEIDASEQMRSRPMDGIFTALEDLGSNIKYLNENKHLPAIVGMDKKCIGQKEITVDITKSSQFISALLIAGNVLEDGLILHTTGSHGMSYIEMTKTMINRFNGDVKVVNNDTYIINGNMKYHCTNYSIEPDVSAACYFYSLSPLLNVDVIVKGVYTNSMQGDISYLMLLEEMGCVMSFADEGIMISPPPRGEMIGITADMSAFSDQAITLAAIAPYASTPTKIKGISHIKYQECNRIDAIVNELTKMNIKVINENDNLTIYPGKPCKTQIETYNDHRVAMGFSLTGIKSEGMIINNPKCCSKTYENYFDDFSRILY